MGSSLALSNTAALPPNLISEQSLRRTPLAVRTTTALYISPFLTRPRGAASLTLTLIMSPIDRKRVVKGTSGSVRVDLGGRRIIRKTTINKDEHKINTDVTKNN